MQSKFRMTKLYCLPFLRSDVRNSYRYFMKCFETIFPHLPPSPGTYSGAMHMITIFVGKHIEDVELYLPPAHARSYSFWSTGILIDCLPSRPESAGLASMTLSGKIGFWLFK